MCFMHEHHCEQRYALLSAICLALLHLLPYSVYELDNLLYSKCQILWFYLSLRV